MTYRIHQKQIEPIKKDLDTVGGAIKVIEPEVSLREIKIKRQSLITVYLKAVKQLSYYLNHSEIMKRLQKRDVVHEVARQGTVII